MFQLKRRLRRKQLFSELTNGSSEEDLGQYKEIRTVKTMIMDVFCIICKSTITVNSNIYQ